MEGLGGRGGKVHCGGVNLFLVEELLIGRNTFLREPNRQTDRSSKKSELKKIVTKMEWIN